MYVASRLSTRLIIFRTRKLERGARYGFNSVSYLLQGSNFRFQPNSVQSYFSTLNQPSSDREENSQSETLSWIDTRAPLAFRPYLKLIRADKQIGTLLLLWPCLWSAALATPLYCLPDVFTMSKFAIGALLMRSAGCIINDMFDKDFDKFVERTKNRPLANNSVSTTQALTLLGSLLACSLTVLLSFNTPSIYLGFGVMPLVIVYPLMKRFTYWPQLSLGLAFNWGSLMGWTAVMGSPSWPVILPLYTAGVSWTLIYDTIYGHQDKKDDLKLGLKSTSILFGEKWTVPAMGFFGGIMTTAFIDAYISSGGPVNLPFIIGLSAAVCHLTWQISTIKVNDKENLMKRFKSNNALGAILLASIVAGKFMG